MDARAVAGGRWLATADYCGSDVLRGAALRRADVRAGRAALAAALAAARGASGDIGKGEGEGEGEYAYSISHTGARGAAVVGPRDDWLGVDLVLLARVSARHAFAIVSAREWQALGWYDPALRPALAWSLKEAAAKATAAPARWFPDGLRIQRSDSGRLTVTLVADPWVIFDADWRVDGSLLCTWVFRRRTQAHSLPSVGRSAASQPVIPADITFTLP